MSVNIHYDAVDVTYQNHGTKTKALANFSMKIESGDFTGFLGESGCGKSTILKLASGLIKPTKGEVQIDGQRVLKADKGTGYVFQGASLLPWLSVYDNIALGYKIRKEKIPKTLIMETIKLVGLSGFELAKPKALSGGMAQRTAIARALVTTPKLLLLDEPFSALDAITRRELQKEVRKISGSQDITTVLVTHDFDEVIRMANKIVLITPRPGSVYKVYENKVGDELVAIDLRKTIMHDIYEARRLAQQN